jgi:DNA polymerase III epsilon subunit family exonuclease
MSVGGSTVVSVTKPTVNVRATAGRRYGEVPLVQGQLAVDGLAAPEPAEADREAIAPRKLALVESAEPELAELEFGELDFAVIDLETTGWSPGAAAITEIAAVRVRGGRRQGEFASLVNPGVPVPPGIRDLTGISDWMLAAAPGLTAVLPGLLSFAGGCVLVAHNAPFDVGFLQAACTQCGLAWPGFTVLDTVMLARYLMDPDEVPDCKLSTLAGFFRARTAPSHRALADARATADVLGWLIRRLTHHGIRTLDQLRPWPDVVA